MFQLPEAWLSLPKALQVFRHLSRERQVAGKEAFDLFDAGAGILGQCVDVVNRCKFRSTQNLPLLSTAAVAFF